MDVIAMHQAGFTNSIASCGTALTNEQVSLISRYADEVILAYDADEAGQKAVAKAIQLFKQTNLKIRVPNLQYGKDPDEIIKNVGTEKFGAMLEGAASDLEFKILEIRKKHNLNLTQGKIDFVNDIVKLLADVSPVEKDLYVSRLSEELGIDKRNLNAQLEDYIKKNSRSKQRAEYKKVINNSISDNAKISHSSGSSVKKLKAEERLIYLLIKYPDCYKMLNGFSPDVLTSGFTRKIFDLVCENISKGDSIDLINFGDKLSIDETGRFSGILARGRESADPKQEFIDCINVITSEYGKKNNNTASVLDDEEFRKAFGNT